MGSSVALRSVALLLQRSLPWFKERGAAGANAPEESALLLPANPYISGLLSVLPSSSRPNRICDPSQPYHAARRSLVPRALPATAAALPPPLPRISLRANPRLPLLPGPFLSRSLPLHGWATFISLRPHIDAHLAGQLMGDILPDWLRGQGFSTCEECQRVFGRPLPAIWPKGLPATGTKVQVWSRCWIMALADIVAHRDARSRTDLLPLPALVLVAQSRSGRALRQESDTRRRCVDWIFGPRYLRSMTNDAVSLAWIFPLVLFPIHSCPGLPLSSRKVLFAALVPPSYKTLRSTPRTTWFQRSAFSTLGLPLRIV